MTNTVEIIKAIGSQWPFLLVLTFIVVLVLKWKEIWIILSTTRKVKIVGQELEFGGERAISEKTDDIGSAPQQTETLKENIAEENEKEEEEEVGIFEKLGDHKYKEAQKLFEERYERKQETEVKKLKSRMWFYYQRFSYGDLSAITELENTYEKAEKHKVLGDFYYVQGLTFFDGQVFDKAIEKFDESLKYENSLYVLNKLWQAHYSNGNKEKALELLISATADFTTDSEKAGVYKYISDFYGKSDEYLCQAIALEKAIEFEPNNTDYLFSAGYNYSKGGLEPMSLVHYRNKIRFDPDQSAMALNNLGVTLKALELKYKSVEYYKRAIELNNTLASSNLAYLYMDSGFGHDASVILKNALSQNDIHENVWTAQNSLQKAIKKEDEKFSELAKAGNEHQKYLRFFAAQFLQLNKTKLDVEFDWVIKGKSFEPKMEKLEKNILIKWNNSKDKHEINLNSLTTVGFCKYNISFENVFKPDVSYSVGFYYFISDRIECLFFNEKKEHEYLTIERVKS